MLYVALDHPAISCHDVNRQADWYCKNLGMRVIASSSENPPSMLLGYDQDATSGPKQELTMLELMPVKDAGPEPVDVPRYQPGLRHLALRVSDFDEAYRRLAGLGIKFLFEPVQAVGGGKLVSFRDPEGNELQIVQRSRAK
jgi:catechol 2,3-dioxygenase-like lactoylglutathione lyase family enzyme